MKNQTNGARSVTLVGSRLEESIPSTILTLISVVCCLCHIGKRQSPPSHNIDKSCTLEVVIMQVAGLAAARENSDTAAALQLIRSAIMGEFFHCDASFEGGWLFSD